MKESIEEQRKKIDELKDQMFHELSENDENDQSENNSLDSGKTNPIISKYMKKINEIIKSTQE